jgi:hypothetical protein
MGLLVDYSCPDCRRPHEAWVQRPVPAEHPCPVCGRAARRRFGGALLRGTPAPSTAAAPSTGTGALCQRYPTVPGLCHMTPAAARGWIARARGDGRSLDRELERQETAVAAGDPAMSVPPINHDHGHGHDRSHGHGHGHDHSHGHAEPARPNTPAPATSIADR